MFTRPQGIAFKNLSQEACGTDWRASLLVASRLAGPAGRSFTKAVIQIGSRLPRSPQTAALGVSLVACANASLVGILSGARLSFPYSRPLAGLTNAGARLPSQVVRAIQSWTLRQMHPRAPPSLLVVPV